MDGIYTLWTGPRRGEAPRLSPLARLLLVTSVLEWRRWNGAAVLYCDRPWAGYLARTGLIDLWDRVDDQVLSEAAKYIAGAGSFWTVGRTLAIAAARVPFASVDVDLIAWRKLVIPRRDGVVFTHWESAQESPWYPSPSELSTPAGYKMDLARDWSRPAANVSFAYFGTAKVRDAYVEEILRFALGNWALVPDELDVAPELLFADQRLLPVIAAECGVPASPLIDATWSPTLDRFVRHDPDFGEWDPLAATDQPTGITHAWFFKSVLTSEDPRLVRLEDELSAHLRANHPTAPASLAR